jgi:hypothetical protein
MEDVTQATIGEVVKQVAGAMSDAVKQYGPDAVDLALVAYRVEAAQQLLHGAVSAAVVVALIVAYQKFWALSAARMTGSYNDEPFIIGRVIFGVLAAIAATLAAASAAGNLLDVSAWLAAFGYPELRIAMKALEAAGLL